MRGAPHSGLAAAILLIKARIPGLAWGRPLPFFLEIQVQKRRKPLRCQPMTVSGLTRSKTFRQFGQVHKSQTQNQRSVARSRGRGNCLFITASCCRRARFSGHFSNLAGPGEEANQ